MIYIDIGLIMTGKELFILNKIIHLYSYNYNRLMITQMERESETYEVESTRN